jgi:YfiH family protein
VRWSGNDGVRWLEADLPGARAVFTARVGGVSAPPFESLNLGILTGDDRDAVRANRRRATAATGLDANQVLMGVQVHGIEVTRREIAPDPNPYADPGPRPVTVEADGQATSTPGLTPAVLVADCLPVALVGPGGIAMVHCGWRGMADGIVERGVRETRATAAAVGPGIGPCCYEVGDEVRQRLESLGPGISSDRMLDLREVAARLLDRAGVGDVQVSELCTSCNPELFFSHRRDGERTGRQAGFVRAGEGA